MAGAIAQATGVRVLCSAVTTTAANRVAISGLLGLRCPNSSINYIPIARPLALT